MKITIQQHGIKAIVEYHDDGLDVYQLGALIHGALTGVGWTEAVLDEIMKKEAFDWSFEPEKESEEDNYFQTIA